MSNQHKGGTGGSDGHGAGGSDHHTHGESAGHTGIDGAVHAQVVHDAYGPAQSGRGGDNRLPCHNPPTNVGDNPSPPTGGGTTHPTEGGNPNPPTEGGNPNPPTEGGNPNPPTEGGNPNPPTEGGSNPPPRQHLHHRNSHRSGATGLPYFEIIQPPIARVEADNGNNSIIRTSPVAVGSAGMVPAVTAPGRPGVMLPS